MADIISPGGNSYRVFRIARKLDQKRDQDDESNLRPHRVRSYGKQSESCICEGSSRLGLSLNFIFVESYFGQSFPKINCHLIHNCLRFNISLIVMFLTD